MSGLRITPPEQGEWMEVRPQLHGTRRVAGHLKIIERSAERVVVYTRYDPDLVIEKHSHLSNEVIFVVGDFWRPLVDRVLTVRPKHGKHLHCVDTAQEITAIATKTIPRPKT